MKKHKNGFTLAEVLITLVIIGIIAAMTIPTLLQNTKNHQYITAYKKLYSSLSQMHLRLKTDNAGYISGIFSRYDDYPTILSKYFSNAKICQSGETAGNCWHEKWYSLMGETVSSNESYASSLILSDGAILLFNHGSSECTANIEMNSDIVCARIRADINGFSKPNTIGLDIFDFYVTEDKIIARGDPLTKNGIDDPSGWGKGYKILTQGKL